MITEKVCLCAYINKDATLQVSSRMCYLLPAANWSSIRGLAPKLALPPDLEKTTESPLCCPTKVWMLKHKG